MWSEISRSFSDQILKKVIYDPFTIIIGIFQKKDLSSGHNRDLIVIWGKKDPILPISALFEFSDHYQWGEGHLVKVLFIDVDNTKKFFVASHSGLKSRNKTI